MVYISPDGSVHNTQPWGLRRVTDIFWGMVAVVCVFLQSLLEPITSLTNGGNSSGSDTSFRNSRGGGTTGGGGGGGGGSGFFGGGGGGRGPPRPPANRRIGRINTAPSCSVPGGCCGQ